MTLFDKNLVLENEQLLLRPSTLDDLDGLYSLANSAIWTHSSTNIQRKQDMEMYLLKAIRERGQKLRQQLTIIDKKNNQLIGCSSFEHISETDKRMEIGWSWLGKSFQGKGYNKIAKFLMLNYAFETLQFKRIEFRTRGTNIQSQKALIKIGAIKEGTLRSYFVAEGKRHDMIYFSILNSEWLRVKVQVFTEMNK